MNSYLFILIYTGKRGLEIRSHGVRPALLMDIHAGRAGRHGGHHSASTDVVRRSSATYRQELQSVRYFYASQMSSADVKTYPRGFEDT